MPLLPVDHRSSDALVVGLVNNMPDAALKTTEWQVRDLLSVGRRAREPAQLDAVAAGAPRGARAGVGVAGRHTRCPGGGFVDRRGNRE